jgi:hypothetical protein
VSKFCKETQYGNKRRIPPPLALASFSDIIRLSYEQYVQVLVLTQKLTTMEDLIITVEGGGCCGGTGCC